MGIVCNTYNRLYKDVRSQYVSQMFLSILAHLLSHAITHCIDGEYVCVCASVFVWMWVFELVFVCTGLIVYTLLVQFNAPTNIACDLYITLLRFIYHTFDGSATNTIHVHTSKSTHSPTNRTENEMLHNTPAVICVCGCVGSDCG